MAALCEHLGDRTRLDETSRIHHADPVGYFRRDTDIMRNEDDRHPEFRLQLAKQRFQSGVSSSLEVLDAERDLFSAQQALVQVGLLRLTNAIDLYRALGGGLDETVVMPTAEN